MPVRRRPPSLAAALAVALSACAGGSGGPGVSSSFDAAPDPVARVGAWSVSLSDLDAEVAEELAEARREVHDARADALDAMIDRRLVEEEAERRGLSVDDLLRVEVLEKVPEPTEDQVRAVYDENAERIGKPIEEVLEPIRDFLRQQAAQAQAAAFVSGLREAADVRVFLEPPRVEVSGDDDPRLGPTDAPVTLVEFTDFQCPFCGRAQGTLKELRERYGDRISVVARDFPLPIHGSAHLAAEAAECADDQGRYWEYRERLFADLQGMDRDDLVARAEDAGLVIDRFAACLDGGTHAAEVDADVRAGSEAGVTGTPTFFINGRMLAGAQPLEAFVKVIDEELRRAGVGRPDAKGAGEAPKVATP